MNSNIKKITAAAMYTAMIFVLTRFVSVPVASGYVHFGDALVYICAASLGGFPALLAAAIGETLADITYGFMNYAVATFFIKILIALPFVLVCKKSEKILTPLTALLSVLGGGITVLGYFLADLVIDKAYAVVDIPGNLIQALASCVIFVLLAAAMDRASLKQKLFINKD